jgi:hypothetical protein
MTDAQASDAARELARARWGDAVLRRSAATVLERGEVTESTRAELEQIAGIPARDGDGR